MLLVWVYTKVIRGFIYEFRRRCYLIYMYIYILMNFFYLTLTLTLVLDGNMHF